MSWLGEWRLLVCCILMNRCSGDRARQVAATIFATWKWPNEVVNEPDNTLLEEICRPLGLAKVRAERIVKLSLWMDLDEPISPNTPSVGRYAWESYLIFIKDEYDFEPQDKELKVRILELRERQV